MSLITLLINVQLDSLKMTMMNVINVPITVLFAQLIDTTVRKVQMALGYVLPIKIALTSLFKVTNHGLTNIH